MIDSTKDLLDSISAQLKAEAIIESCLTSFHFDYAQSFIELFHYKFNDIKTYDLLCELLKEKKIKLNYHD